MRGVPRILKTRADFERCQAMARDGRLGQNSLRRLFAHWEGLLAGRYYYVLDRVLADTEEPDGSPPEYIVREVDDEDSGETRREQLKRVERVPSALERIGVSVSDAEDAMTELEGMIDG